MKYKETLHPVTGQRVNSSLIPPFTTYSGMRTIHTRSGNGGTPASPNERLVISKRLTEIQNNFPSFRNCSSEVIFKNNLLVPDFHQLRLAETLCYTLLSSSMLFQSSFHGCNYIEKKVKSQVKSTSNPRALQ